MLLTDDKGPIWSHHFADPDILQIAPMPTLICSRFVAPDPQRMAILVFAIHSALVVDTRSSLRRMGEAHSAYGSSCANAHETIVSAVWPRYS